MNFKYSPLRIPGENSTPLFLCSVEGGFLGSTQHSPSFIPATTPGAGELPEELAELKAAWLPGELLLLLCKRWFLHSRRDEGISVAD